MDTLSRWTQLFASHPSRLALGAVLLFSGWLIPGVRAAESTPAYAAIILEQSAETLTLASGKAATVTITFKNTGTATWTNRDNHFVALNVTAPAGRKSAFRHRFWKKSYRPAVLQTPIVEPGESGTVRFALQAPQTPGTYTETFQLVAENLTWIPGTVLTLPITVVPPPPAFAGRVVGQSPPSITLTPGTSMTVWVDVKNTGTATWTNSGKNFVALNVTAPAGRASAFKHSSWREYPYRPSRLDTLTVKPGETGRVEFAITAPTVPGTYTETFQLVAENLTWIPGTVLTLPITVVPPPPPASTGEPVIDVGLRVVTEPIIIRANGTFTVRTGETAVSTIPANTSVTFSYTDGVYTAQLSDQTLNGSVPYVANPDTVDTILEAVNFENRPGWNPALNDNLFRGSLRLQYATATSRLWLINRLPLESYLRGIAETSNASPMEYQKAILTAARTYAHYHYNTRTKHDEENFIVDATNDQVYRGYGIELRAPNITAAVEATRGTVVTYNNEIVVTPYFSQSDGRTRAWEEVWGGGPFAWLISKPDPACAGLPLLGHGVGMSAVGAFDMGNNGKTYDEILKYYYTGVELQKVY
ncbi:MAG: hypothetical protein HY340_03625 [Candidatus Kerfeldbacteria bacterium]|nr:hypothetical protein [Candidatus Kerfeldbacteria bacterium]